MGQLRFIIFGGLSSVKQKGYNPSMPTYHCPPKRRGIYAFPENFIEFFLLGGTMSNIYTKHSKFEWVKDKEGNRIEVVPIPDEVNYSYAQRKCPYPDGIEYKQVCASGWTQKDKKDDKTYYVKLKKHKKFEYTGEEIWHHLEDKTPLNEIIEKKGCWIKTTVQSYKEAFKKAVSHYRHGYYRYSKDFMEVFIEKV